MARRRHGSEAELQHTIRHALTVLGVPCFRLNSGAHAAASPNGRMRFIRYGFLGCPDLFALLVDGRTLWIEVKTPRGRLSPAQREFGRLCAQRGVPWVCARSIDDVLPWIPVQRHHTA